MAYGTVKVDNVTFTYNTVDTSTTFSGLHASTTNNLTLSGTASANTFTGTTANFTTANAQNISVTTLLSGLAITGGTAGFTTVTGTTVTGTTANFASGVFTTEISGVTITGTTVAATTGTFTSLTGTTTTGTTANFASGVFTTQISGVTITGTTVSTTTGNFTSLTGTTATFTSGIIASGTALLPSLAILLDPNTGIYSPGEDQLAVATNGVGALFVTASGNIGVQTGSPTSALDISYAGGTSSNDKLTLKLGADVGNLTSRTVNTRKFAVIGAANYSNATKNIGMMYLDSDVSTSKLWFGGGATGIYDATEINFVTAATTTSTAGLQRMVITSGGLVGIGTSSPNQQLELQGANAYTSRLRFSYGSSAPTYFADWGYSSDGNKVYLTITDNNIAKNVLVANYAGNVGIGTTSPGSYTAVNAANLVVGTNSGSNGITVVGGTTGYSALAFADSAGTGGTGDYAGLIQYGHSTDSMSFFTGATLKATIDSSGRLLVGTTTAFDTSYIGTNYQIGIEKLNTYAGFAMKANFNNADGCYILMAKSRGSSLNTKTVVNDGDNVGAIVFEGADGTNMVRAAQITCLIDGTPAGPSPGPVSMPGRLTFSTTPDSGSSPTSSPPAMTIKSSQEVLIGTSTITANGGILQLKSGITFPATAVAASDANTLDDYEEGTWTPVIRGSSIAGTYELITATGFYTKIGRQVTLSMVLKLDTAITGGGNGYTQITGLPFGHKDNSQPALACATSGIDYSTNYTSIFFGPITGASTTTWFLSERGDNVIENDLNISAISANDSVVCSSSYITN